MISIVLVSHSQKITEGLQEMIVEMVVDTVHIISSGGTGDGRLGTNAIMIADNIATCTNSEHIYILRHWKRYLKCRNSTRIIRH